MLRGDITAVCCPTLGPEINVPPRQTSSNKRLVHHPLAFTSDHIGGTDIACSQFGDIISFIRLGNMDHSEVDEP